MSLLRELVDNNIKRLSKEDINDVTVFLKVEEYLDKNISLHQVEQFERCLDYIDKCIERDTQIIEQEYIKNMRLTNYTFVNKGKYIWIVDKCATDPNSSKKEPYKYATISLGNDKLVSNLHTQFVIWNVLQRVTCRNSTESCRKFCYANQYPCNYQSNSPTKAIRRKNTVFSMLENFDEIMIELLNFIALEFRANIVFRFHESGDVYSRLYFSKIKNIMSICKDIKFMWYSKSLIVLDEINQLNEYENISLRYSLDFSTPNNIVKKVKEIDCLNTVVMPIDSLDEHLVDDITAATYCNLKKEKEFRQFISMKIAEQKELLEQELLEQKIAGKVIKYKINDLNKEIKQNRKMFIDEDVKCGSCLKCLNKNLRTISFCQHGRI